MCPHSEFPFIIELTLSKIGNFPSAFFPTLIQNDNPGHLTLGVTSPIVYVHTSDVVDKRFNMHVYIGSLTGAPHVASQI